MESSFGPQAVDNGDGTWTFTISPAPTDSLEYLLVKDGVMEKIMGYTGKRPGVFKIPELSSVTSESCVSELMSFATKLKQYGDMNGFHDIGNLADTLSGEAAKTKYLLTLS